MRFKRDFSYKIALNQLPVKVLKGPKLVGKKSILHDVKDATVVYLDDPAIKLLAQKDPRHFLDQYQSPLILDEAALVPEMFSEIKRRVDEFRRDPSKPVIDYWITGSNQTLLRRNVSESLAGRANFFDLNTLSVHEIGSFDLQAHYMRGGWPEIRSKMEMDAVRYLNDILSSFVEKDVAISAGVEKLAQFQKLLVLNAGRIGQLYNTSEIAQLISVDFTTVQSWNALLQMNGILELVQPYYTNINKRRIKTPKLYFQDVALATRLQGWTEFHPLFASPYFGAAFENIVFSEIHRYFINSGRIPKFFMLGQKKK